MKKFSSLLTAALAVMLLLPGATFAQAPKDAKSTTAKTTIVAGPSDKDIADAKAKGLVWVNTDSKVFHKDGQFYGHTKQGKFMTEADALKAGFRAAKQSAADKKATAKKAKS